MTQPSNIRIEKRSGVDWMVLLLQAIALPSDRLGTLKQKIDHFYENEWPKFKNRYSHLFQIRPIAEGPKWMYAIINAICSEQNRLFTIGHFQTKDPTWDQLVTYFRSSGQWNLLKEMNAHLFEVVSEP